MGDTGVQAGITRQGRETVMTFMIGGCLEKS